MKPWATTTLERKLAKQYGARTIAGLDEVGRGAFAGPLVAGCFVWNLQIPLPQVRDSKLLSRKQRHRLMDALFRSAISWSVGIVEADEINAHGITWANREVFLRAIDQLPSRPDIVLYDGKKIDLKNRNTKNVIDGDATCATIAAASIIAKVVRDLFMQGLHNDHPAFGFDHHVGYGTLKHLTALKKFGKLRHIHRDAFIHS